MNCADARLLLQVPARFLEPGQADNLSAHVAHCSACQVRADNERELTSALENKLPVYAASFALKTRVRSAWPAPSPSHERATHARATGERLRNATKLWVKASVAVGALAVAVGAVALTIGLRHDGARAPATLVAEAVNDHLRVLEGDRVIEVVASDVHQVKPWFAGRLDFGPVVPFEGDDELVLKGGTISRFLDRRAATFVWGYRLHRLSLFVFRPEGLPVPDNGARQRGSDRGFGVVLWQEHGLAYALAGDVAMKTLDRFAGKIAGF